MKQQRQPRLFVAGRIRPTAEVLDLVIPQHDVMTFELMVEAMRIKHAKSLGADVARAAA